MADDQILRALVADWVVECRSSSPEVLAELRRLLGPAPEVSDAERPGDLIIEARVIGDAAMPLRDRWTLMDEDDVMAMWKTPSGTGLTLGRSQAQLGTAFASFFFPDAVAAHHCIHSFVTAAINHKARMHGVVPAHSAMICVDGVWMLLVGPSGIGKSTACLSASTAGHQVASDDTCLLRSSNGVLYGHGLPRAPSLPLAEHGLADGRPIDHRERTSEPEFRLLEGWHRLAGVLVLEHGHAQESTLGSPSAIGVIEAITSSVGGSLSADVVVDSAPEVMRAAVALPARILAIGSDASHRMQSTNASLVAAALQFDPSD